MARSRVGGSSAKISGVLGSLLYTVGKSSAGGYQQYIANYTGIRTNPNTKYQALARMQIAVIERMVQILSPVLQTSFEGVDVGVNSVNEFARQNMRDIQDYCKNYWEYAFGWCFPMKGQELTAWAPMIISLGSLAAPKAVTLNAGGFPHYRRNIEIDLPTGKYRYIDIRKALGISKDGSFNLVIIDGEYDVFKTGACLLKCRLNPAINDYTDIRNLDPETLFLREVKMFEQPFLTETTISHSITYLESANRIYIYTRVITRMGSSWSETDQMLAGIVWSDRKKSRWCKSSTRLAPPFIVSEEEQFGRSPQEAFYTWFDNYDGQGYDEFFGRSNNK